MNNKNAEKLKVAMEAIVSHCAKLSQAEVKRYLAALSRKILAERAVLASDDGAPCPLCKRGEAVSLTTHSFEGHPMEPYGDPRWEYDPTPYAARYLQ